MVTGKKFYLYAKTWRELDLDSGSVAGLGEAEFAYVKRGKLKIAKTGAVLSALRDNSIGNKSAVKDAFHLPFKKIEKPQVKGERLPDTRFCAQSHYCHHTNNNGCQLSNITPTPTKKQPVETSDAGIQTSQPSETQIHLENKKPYSVKRHRECTNFEDTPAKTIAMQTIGHDKVDKLLLQKKWSLVNSSAKSSRKKVESAKYNIYKRRRSQSNDSIEYVVFPKYNDSIENCTSTKKMPEYVQAESIERKRRKSTSDSSQEFRPKSKKRRNSAYIARNNNATEIFKSTDAKHTGKSNVTSNVENVSKRPKQDHFRELIIDEADVNVLRTYLKNRVPDFDLLKFDEDDEYKRQFFYTINPLVNVERCPRIARILRRDSQQDEIKLKDFASQLGLKSISEKSVPQRYKMRKTNERNILYRKTDKTDSGSDVKRILKRNGDISEFRKRCITDSDTEIESDFEERDERKNKPYNSKIRGDIAQAKQSTTTKRRHSRSNKNYTDSEWEEFENNSTNTSESKSRNKIKGKKNKNHNDERSETETELSINARGRRQSTLDNKKNKSYNISEPEEISEDDKPLRTQKITRQNKLNQIKDSNDRDDNTEAAVTELKALRSRRYSTFDAKINQNSHISESQEDFDDEPPNSPRSTRQNKLKEIKHTNDRNEKSKADAMLSKNIKVRRQSTLGNRSTKDDKYPNKQKNTSENKLNERKYTNDKNNSTSDDDSETENRLRGSRQKKNKPNIATTSTIARQNVLSADTETNNRKLKEKANNIVPSKEHSKNTSESKSRNKIKGKKIKNHNDVRSETETELSINVRGRRQSTLDNKKNKSYNVSEPEEISEDDKPLRTQKITRQNKLNQIKDSNDRDDNTEAAVTELKALRSRRYSTFDAKINQNSNISESQEDFDDEPPNSPRSTRQNKLKEIKHTNDRNEISKADAILSKNIKGRRQSTLGNRSTKDDKSPNKQKNTSENKLNETKYKNDKNNSTSDDDSETENRLRGSIQKKNKPNIATSSTIARQHVVSADTETNNRKLKEKANNIVPSKEHSKNNDTTETIDLTDIESDVSGKKPTIIQVKSLAVNSNRYPSSSSNYRTEYSNLEDQVILTWISAGNRAKYVNGNRIWKDLQDSYLNLSGLNRSWHSLRNRYLRQILPWLGSYALSPSLVARLRAAAATGEIKTRSKVQNRRNSIFRPVVPGALSRRLPTGSDTPSEDEHPPPPKKHKHDNTSLLKSPPVRRVLRSSLPSSQEKLAQLPCYSEITRRFASAHRDESTPNTSFKSVTKSNERESAKKKTENVTENSLETRKITRNSMKSSESAAKNSTKELSLTKSQNSRRDKSPAIKETLKSLAIHLSLPKSRRSASPHFKDDKAEKETTKTRRLYNPSALI